MARHVQGIAIVIKAFLPTGSTIDEQFAALGMVKDAHASGDYSKVLASANIDEVKSEQKTRRVEDQPQGEQTAGQGGEHLAADNDEPSGTVGGAQMEGDDDPSSEGVPEFLKNGKTKAA